MKNVEQNVLVYTSPLTGIYCGKYGCGLYYHAPPISSIFGYEGAEAEDIMYVNWLSMLRAGLIALEFYTPETKKWRQVCYWSNLYLYTHYSLVHT